MQRADGVLQPQRANADGHHVSVYSTGALARARSTSFIERHAEERVRLCSSHLTTGMQRVAADTKRGHGWRSRDREGTRRMKGGFCASAWNAARFQVTHDQLKKPRRGALAGGPACASTRCSVRMSLSSPTFSVGRCRWWGLHKLCTNKDGYSLPSKPRATCAGLLCPPACNKAARTTVSFSSNDTLTRQQGGRRDRAWQ